MSTSVTGRSLIPFAAVFTALAMSLALPGTLRGESIPLVAILDGGQVVPTFPTQATGFAQLTYDTGTQEFSWEISYTEDKLLFGQVTALHFHGPAAAGESALVRLDISAAGSQLSSPIAGSATLQGAMESELLNGLWYMELHTSAPENTAEIRGQVSIVAEPSTFTLAGTAGLSLLVYARRRQRERPR